jgi:hypothetical protein
MAVCHRNNQLLNYYDYFFLSIKISALIEYFLIIRIKFVDGTVADVIPQMWSVRDGVC